MPVNLFFIQQFPSFFINISGMIYKVFLPFIFFIAFHFSVSAQQTNTFTVVPLGTEGGLNEANLSSYLLADKGSQAYICLDAGTIYTGVQKAISNKVFSKQSTAFIRQNIKAYLISHPHLDHVTGLIINSPSDTNKNVYGTKFCLDKIAEHYFSWQTWANFSDEGEKPTLGKYHFKELEEEKEQQIEGTNLFVTAFRLSHSEPYQSTAFLIRKDSSYVLYFGDTGADTIEHSQHLYHVWQQVAPLINNKHLKGIFLECSYPNEQPEKQLFGHLTPKLLWLEMSRLATLCKNKNALLNIPLVITHMKPEGNNEAKIRQQVMLRNTLQMHIIFPQQGKRFSL